MGDWVMGERRKTTFYLPFTVSAANHHPITTSAGSNHPSPSLLTYPLPAPALRPHPGGGVGAGTGIEDVVLGEWGAEPGPRLELEQSIRAAPFVDCRRHE